MANYGQSPNNLGNKTVQHIADLTAREKETNRQSNKRIGKFEIYEDDSGQWRFRLKAGNGEVIAVSESYTSKDGALNGVDSVRRNARTTRIDEV